MSEYTASAFLSRRFSGRPTGYASVRRFAILGVGLAAAVLFGPLKVGGDYGCFLAAAIAYNSITVLTLSLLASYSGIWSMAQPAFVALGAYVTANMAAAGLPIEVILPVILVFAGSIGFGLGIMAGRFSILYFGLLTLAVSLTATEIIGRWSSVTGGDEGLTVTPLQSLIAWQQFGIDNGAPVSIVLATCVFFAYDFVIMGNIGRRWRAIKSQRVAATAIGLIPHIQNAIAFAVSAALASVAGACIAVSIGYLEPGAFSLDAGIMTIVATVLGGVGSFVGAIVGAAFLVLVPEIGRNFSDFSAFVFGATVILVLLFLPRGVVPSLRDFLADRLTAEPVLKRSPEQRGTQTAEIAELAKSLMSKSKSPLIVDDLTVSFGGLRALQNVSFTVNSGQTVGLIGPNGAGKTTVLNALSGYVKTSPESTIIIGSASLRDKQAWERRGLGMARTFQHNELFGELSVRDNLIVSAAAAIGRSSSPSEVADRIITALRLETVASKKPPELPFGVQKVVDVGRCLAVGATFVALDEPFSGLDAVELVELREILNGMRQAGVSILLIDHAVDEVLHFADHVVVLDFGKVLSSGEPGAVRQDPKVLEAYFGAISEKKGHAPRPDPNAPTAIRVENVTHRYGGVLAIDDVSLSIARGSFSALLGPNGAGKSTLSMIMTGVQSPTLGKVLFRSAHTDGGSTGPKLIPEGRRLFGQLSVRENLMLGGFAAGKSDAASRKRMAEVVELMPTSVQEGLDRMAATLSGGERQMVALGRAVMAGPQVLIVDEPSMGLAPIAIRRFYSILKKLNSDGVTVVVVEQLATHALEFASTIIVMHRGKIAYAGSAAGEVAERILREGFSGDYASSRSF